MKQVLAVLTAIIVLNSCQYTSGSGNIKSETRSISNFTEISVGSSFDVEVKIGPVTEVRVEADDNIIKYIETEVSGNTLKIRLEDNHAISNAHLNVYITMPALTAVRTSGSASVIVEDVITSKEKLSFKASSSSDIKAEVDAPEVEAETSSSATINLSGKTRTYHASASSSSDIKSWDLLSENATAKASSSATIKLHASVSLDARASSSADVVYHGAASVSKSVSSSGSVEKRD
ncbi:MAG: head GIN domain-containing protein [Ferruginibacter sp.]